MSHYATQTPDPWKAEAVNALLEVFDPGRTNQFDAASELETLLEGLTQQGRMSPSAG
ncbi:hypothetical protein [Hymenobacter sp. HDW8]|uniref:hypothetical protein n=1 Tax=Hymenobacter sp. HDW8 TaxID=2714932 RepID=UPI00140DF97B|nr:hypothetical protein [Hymenobacter sp. HDW8]QIL78366.1 hypothetical protein G7064_21360 [Hymenobacter sp. HDW8]